MYINLSIFGLINDTNKDPILTITVTNNFLGCFINLKRKILLSYKYIFKILVLLKNLFSFKLTQRVPFFRLITNSVIILDP